MAYVVIREARFLSFAGYSQHSLEVSACAN